MPRSIELSIDYKLYETVLLKEYLFIIIREHPNHFIMIEQDNHAQLYGEMIANWNDSLFNDTKFKKTVEFAIFHHDCGWKSFDKQPFWNDEKMAPFTFTNFPILPKTVLYKHG